MPSWFDDAAFLLHLEQDYTHSHHGMLHQTPLGAARVLLQELRPDAVCVTAKGRSGYVPYATALGNALYGAGGNADPLARWRELTRAAGCRLVFACSDLLDERAANYHPEWQRVLADQRAYPTRALCPNSSYPQELLLPQLDELLERYAPDGILTTGGNWTVAPCYCSGCLVEFRMLYGAEPPLRRGEQLWNEWLQFQRDSYTRHADRVARFLHERDTGLVVAGSGAYCSLQPEPAPPGGDRLTWLLAPAFALSGAGLEARLLDARELPFDLTLHARCSARPRPSGNQPALPAYPKSTHHLLQEAAVVLASGGRCSVLVPGEALPAGEDEPEPGALPEELPAVAAVGEHARRVRALCAGSVSRACAAVLHSDAAHRLAGNGLYDGGPCLDRLRGAHLLLAELHYPHDLVTEDALLRRLPQYRVLVLPEQGGLSSNLEEPLLEWVREGGILVVTGRSATRLLEDVPTFVLEDALGVTWTGRRDEECRLLLRGRPLPVVAPTWRVRPYSAQVHLPLLRPAATGGEEPSEEPAVTRHLYGSGEAWYVAVELCSAYYRCRYPGLRTLFADILERALPHPPLQTDAPPWVEVTWRRRDGMDLVHLVNHSPGKSQAGNSLYVERVPAVEPFSLALALEEPPAAVRLLEAGQEAPRVLEWDHAEGMVAVTISGLRLHGLLCVEH